MDDELYFKCDTCHGFFEPDPDSMISVEIASYNVSNMEIGVESSLTQTSALDVIDEDKHHILVHAPIEFSNVGACVCYACRKKYNFNQDEDN